MKENVDKTVVSAEKNSQKQQSELNDFVSVVQTEKNKSTSYSLFCSVSSVIAVMLIFGSFEIFAQGTGRGDPAQVGAIVGWIMRLAYAVLGVMGAFKIIGGWGMMGEGQQGWQRKMGGGLGYMASAFLVGIGVELSQGNLPDLGLEGVFGF